jgi:hypothetical protein
MIDVPAGRIKMDAENMMTAMKHESVGENMIPINHTLVAQIVGITSTTRPTLTWRKTTLDGLTGRVGRVEITSSYVLDRAWKMSEEDKNGG